ncbi:proton-translocating transhydrogenase family protein, partial [Actinomyces slackii]
ALAAALVLVTPAAAATHYIVLTLAIILGFHVISNVTPALHTPLMSVTNAISGIILVGAISQVGNADPLISGISLVAIVLASINVFGGFAVTHRMLAMFRKD